jgi:hypothetical protein
MHRIYTDVQVNNVGNAYEFLIGLATHKILKLLQHIEHEIVANLGLKTALVVLKAGRER